MRPKSQVFWVSNQPFCDTVNAYSTFKSSLSTKLIAPILFIGLLILLGFLVFFVFFAKAVVDQQASEKASGIAEALIIAIEADTDKAGANRVISALATRKNIIRLSLVEAASGKIVADSQQAYIGKYLDNTYNAMHSSRFGELQKKK
ncbi:MAG: hypothetical protein KTR17_04640 [Cellvibrionaceae bacterium]|nr:hypothetical protein [Cellvibrionaceae bacterium]